MLPLSDRTECSCDACKFEPHPPPHLVLPRDTHGVLVDLIEREGWATDNERDWHYAPDPPRHGERGDWRYGWRIHLDTDRVRCTWDSLLRDFEGNRPPASAFRTFGYRCADAMLRRVGLLDTPGAHYATRRSRPPRHERTDRLQATPRREVPLPQVRPRRRPALALRP